MTIDLDDDFPPGGFGGGVVARHRRRERLGRLVRDVWIAWAREQPAPKPSWLVPWDELPEPDREVDRRIGEELARAGRDEQRPRFHAIAVAHTELATARERIRELEAQIAALAPYATHRHGRCDMNGRTCAVVAHRNALTPADDWGPRKPEPECDCGRDAALRGAT